MYHSQAEEGLQEEAEEAEVLRSPRLALGEEVAVEGEVVEEAELVLQE